MTHWYFPSLEKSTACSCRVVVYSVTSVSPPAAAWMRRCAWLWISASFRTSLSFFQAKVMGESLELAAEQTKVTLAPRRADWVSGCTVIWGFGKSSVSTTKVRFKNGCTLLLLAARWQLREEKKDGVEDFRNLP